MYIDIQTYYIGRVRTYYFRFHATDTFLVLQYLNKWICINILAAFMQESVFKNIKNDRACVECCVTTYIKRLKYQHMYYLGSYQNYIEIFMVFLGFIFHYIFSLFVLAFQIETNIYVQNLWLCKTAIVSCRDPFEFETINLYVAIFRPEAICFILDFYQQYIHFCKK